MRQAMTVEMFKAILEKAECKTKGGESTLPEGRTIALYVAHEGVSLTISRLVSLRLDLDGLLIVGRDHRGEMYLVALADVFAASVAGGSGDTPVRKAGFLG
jgi:hypothetical protein